MRGILIVYTRQHLLCRISIQIFLNSHQTLDFTGLQCRGVAALPRTTTVRPVPPAVIRAAFMNGPTPDRIMVCHFTTTQALACSNFAGIQFSCLLCVPPKAREVTQKLLFAFPTAPLQGLQETAKFYRSQGSRAPGAAFPLPRECAQRRKNIVAAFLGKRG